MRIAFITGEYPPMEGGVGAFTREVARAAAKMGSEVLVVTRTGGAEVAELDVKVYPLVGKSWGWATLQQIARWVEQQRPDVVNIQFQTAAYNMHPSIHWVPRRLSRTPVVVTFHDLRVPYLFPKAGPIRTHMVRKLALDADGVIATDRADEATLRDSWHTPMVRWIPIGSNISTMPPEDFNRDQWRSVLGIGPGDCLISYFGFLNESKGGMTLLHCLDRLIQAGVPAHLVMIGGRAGSSDPTNVAYGQCIDSFIESHRLQERVHWTGFVDDVG
jgi:glycosyltransferase involved in cell wall biosynthesis